MISSHDTLQSSLIKLSQGNPGALRVLCELVKADPTAGLISMLDADDMGLRGPAIWVGYKDFAKGDLQVFREALRNRSSEMITVIRQEGYEAYTGGRSYLRPRRGAGARR